MSTPLLQVKNLCTSFDVDAGEVRAVNDKEDDKAGIPDQ